MLAPPSEGAGAPTRTARDGGLATSAAEAALRSWGPNELPESPRPRLLRRIGRALVEPMALLLLAAAAVSGLVLGERLEGFAIAAIVVLNTFIGLAEEGRASRALEALRELETPTARVLRDGAAREIPARQVVPGDLVVLAPGDRVPADAVLVESASMEADESLLSGESLPVSKRTANPSAGWTVDEPGEDARVHAGTLVTRGTGRAVVVATGPRTRVGRISSHLQQASPDTPLQIELARVGARLGMAAVVVAVLVFGLILLRDPEALEQGFLTAVALAVAAVPEGLATVVVLALALGVRRMAAKGAIVRRLPAVETLGSATAILTDKTGTLTENRLRVEAVVPAGDLDRARLAAVLCNDAVLDPSAGDPLEVALLEWAGRTETEWLRAVHPRLASEPFDADRRLMSVVCDVDGRAVLFVKGAPEAVLARCTDDGTGRPITAEDRARFEAEVDAEAARGMRMLALAVRDLGPVRAVRADAEAHEQDLVLAGLVGLRDPVRPEAARTVEEAAAAGIRVVMVTGDHPGTAATIAREVGLGGPGARARTGADLGDLEGGRAADPLGTAVYARVDPEQKLALVRAARGAGHVVAVTGDGVNDAPAIHHADIGVAMGKSGTDVAREAADLVITDDNLATILEAVREGRAIYDRIRKVVDYLVAGNASEILVVVACLLVVPALGVPLFPLQLLWINLLTDGLPALALAVDPASPVLMSRPPRDPRERLLNGARLRRLGVRATLMSGAAVASLAAARGWLELDWAEARTVMFSTLVGTHLLYAFVARLPAGPLRDNRALVGAVGIGIGLQVLVVAVPALRSVFATTALGWSAIAVVLVGSIVPPALMWSMRGWAGARGPA